jgi:hypothetical protein
MDVMDTPHPLIETWRLRATDLRRYGATEAVTTLETCASELASFEIEHGLELLTLTQAAGESGFSAPHLSRALTEGRIENAGEEGHPRIRRKDLPRKIAPPSDDGVDLAGAVKRAQKGQKVT